METITQRQLRNDNAEIMRRVEQGETFTVTRRGVPVAQLGPITDRSRLRCVKPAEPWTTFADIRRVRTSETSETVQEMQDDLRADR